MIEKDTDVRIGKFTVLRRLGRGGMGAVYEGYDPALDRHVAIKTLTTDAITDRESRGRFEREAKAAAKLSHPNIVTVYELGNFGGTEKPYIVMEYLEGDDVASVIERGGLPLSEALDITIQLLRALDFAHQNGVVHRDVKPSNLRYLDNGQIKIMDFGIARVEGSQQITKSGVMIGTVHYMSPEQIRGQKLDGRTDLFAAGCILYELLTGERPFAGDSATSILYNIVNETPTPITEKNRELPQEIQKVLDHALAKNPEGRYRTAGEMARELEKLLTIVRKTLPRTTGATLKGLEELDSMARAKEWRQVSERARALLDENPQLEEARRHLRRARRELQEREQSHSNEEKTRHLQEIHRELTELYGEQAETIKGSYAETELGAPAGSRTAPGGARTLDRSGDSDERESTAAVRALAAPIWALVFVVLLGIGGTLYWMFIREPPAPETVSHRLRVVSSPPGAAVSVNGRATGAVTGDGGIEIPVSGLPEDKLLVELSLSGFASASREIVLGAEPPADLRFELEAIVRRLELVTTPPGATVTLDGERLEGVTPMTLELPPDGEHTIVLDKPDHQPRTIAVDATSAGPDGPIALTPLGRPGTFRVASTYPVAIRRNGAVLAPAGEEPSISLRPASYELELFAPEVFLRRSYQVTIREDEVSTEQAPALGRVNVRANPGNCTVSIDGIPAGSPPFMNKTIVEGLHEFAFTWPDGVTDVQRLRVEAGKPTYVIGQRP